jgi:hypothetical protein
VGVLLKRLSLRDAQSGEHAHPIRVGKMRSLGSTSFFNWSKAVASPIGSMFAGTPDASGNVIGLATPSNG